MQFYTRSHNFYCGIDLHTRKMYLCILNSEGEAVFHRNRAASPEAFLTAIAPFREDLVVCCECMHCWYWLADLCFEEGIEFVLGHAYYMKAIHGAKSKNDRIDSEKIARMLRGGLIPMAYVYPHEMRETRDLLRRRSHFVRKRTELLCHLQGLSHQNNLPDFDGRITGASKREEFLERFSISPSLELSAKSDQELIERYEVMIPKLERFIEREIKEDAVGGYYLLRSIPGIGKILAMTILYEIHTVDRFPTCKKFASYARLVRCQHSSNGKISGHGGSKMGSMHLKWAFSEASAYFLRGNTQGKQLLAQLEKKHGKGAAMSILAHKLGRTVYFMLRRKQPFNPKLFYRNSA
jgi:transposase